MMYLFFEAYNIGCEEEELGGEELGGLEWQIWKDKVLGSFFCYSSSVRGEAA